MVTPKGGLVLDPFAGSGSTLVADEPKDEIIENNTKTNGTKKSK